MLSIEAASDGLPVISSRCMCMLIKAVLITHQPADTGACIRRMQRFTNRSAGHRHQTKAEHSDHYHPTQFSIFSPIKRCNDGTAPSWSIYVNSSQKLCRTLRPYLVNNRVQLSRRAMPWCQYDHCAALVHDDSCSRQLHADREQLLATCKSLIHTFAAPLQTVHSAVLLGSGRIQYSTPRFLITFNTRQPEVSHRGGAPAT